MNVDKDGNVHLNVGEFGTVNLNGHIYTNGEHITAGKVSREIFAQLDNPKIIDENMKPVQAKPVESEVTFYNESRIPLEKLTMKNEYKFESWQKAMGKDDTKTVEIDSIPKEVQGVGIETGKVLVVGAKSLIGPTDWNKILNEGKQIPLEDLHAGISPRKTMMGVTTGMALFSDFEGYGMKYRQFPEKEASPTVRTNGRQKLVDNGKCTWPSAKQRKGHRKHG